jgi:hypothetical protein
MFQWRANVNMLSRISPSMCDKATKIGSIKLASQLRVHPCASCSSVMKAGSNHGGRFIIVDTPSSDMAHPNTTWPFDESVFDRSSSD